jgi:hypothetical protein
MTELAKNLTLREIEERLDRNRHYEKFFDSVKAIHDDMTVLIAAVAKGQTIMKPRAGGFDRATPPKKKTTKKTNKKKANGKKGHKATCPNPDCREVSGRASRNFIAHHHDTHYCTRECANYVSNRLRRFCDLVYFADQARIEKYLQTYPWIKDAEFKKRLDSLMPKVEAYHIRKVRKETKKQKGTTILKTTPTV